MTKVIGLSGGDSAIRQDLVEVLVAELTRMDLKVSVALRMTDDFEIDKPGKDSYEHRRAGAREVVLASSERWAIMSECGSVGAIRLQSLMSRTADPDLLIAVGFDDDDHPRLFIVKPGEDPNDVVLSNRNVVACLSNGSEVRSFSRPVFRLDDTRAIAAFIVSYVGPDSGD
jgi:molybdopterin-guanine dinucleotide biosynthesis protein B